MSCLFFFDHLRALTAMLCAVVMVGLKRLGWERGDVMRLRRRLST